ncbi:hypothetical protein OQA88_3772 [Cercophora sp. LCS_1]
MATSNDLPPPPSAPSQHPQPYQQQYQQVQPQRLPVKQPPVTQRPVAQSRKSRSFSFRSDKSHGSHKYDLTETHAEKDAKRLHTKADPTLAMNEAEPAEVAATGKSSLAPLRSIQHKDAFGNPIADPDRSNPTRSRWERPLDTIRSFEAAIDGQYSSRRSMLRSDNESINFGNNRRNSYYGNNNGRFSHDSYYGSRPPSMMYGARGDGGVHSQYDLRQSGYGQRDTYYDQQGPGNSYHPAPGQGRRGYPRMSSEPPFGRPHQQQPEYQIPSNHRSYETVASASGSGTSGEREPSGYQTDPTSSDNSSIERVQAAPKPQPPPQPMNDYGIGFSQSSSYGPGAFTVGLQDPTPTNSNGKQPIYPPNYAGAPPPVPQKGPAPVLRKPTAVEQVQQRPAPPEKRKSWFTRRFSKHG